jgi:isopropylmalate/homocitrate/citramalate synthase
MITVLDSTLREGELQPGVYFTRGSRLVVGKGLAEIGTKRIEFPIVYPNRGESIEDIKSVTDEIQRCYSDVTTILQIRAHRDDIDVARKYDVGGCAIYQAPTEMHRRDKFRGLEQDKLVENFVNMLSLLKDYGFEYRRATLEDASRFVSEERGQQDTFEFLGRLLGTVERAGATVISIPDTSGILPPSKCAQFINEVKKFTRAPLACHFHNDYGNALTNALIAAGVPGVEEVHVSILGLGARNGITDHYEFIATLHDLQGVDCGERRDQFRPLYERFEQVTGVPIPWRHPLSHQCFTEKAGTHQSQVVRDPKGYIPSKKVDYDSKGTIRFEAGQLMSTRIVNELLDGHDVGAEAKDSVVTTIAGRSALRRRPVSPWEVREIVREKAGVDLPIDKVSRVIRGSDFTYILVKMVPQYTTAKMLEELSLWPEIETVDEVYGEADLILLTRLKDASGTDVVDKIRARFKDGIIKTVTLPVG